MSINKPAKGCGDGMLEDIIEESAEKSICTQVKYNDDFMEMIRPTVEYAKANGIQLTGDIFGWENTNYYVSGRRRALYRIYALIK